MQQNMSGNSSNKSSSVSSSSLSPTTSAAGPPPRPPAERSLPPTISWPPPPGLLSPLKLETGRMRSGGGSRSPSPLHLSLSTSGSHKSSQESPISPPRLLAPEVSPPRDGGDFSYHPSLPPPPPPTSLAAMYGFPPPLPFLSGPTSHLALPFYRLSPLLAANPFLANSILFSLAGQKHQADLLKVNT
jgi:hypothetical protein